jgi:hypothetical protein
MTDLIIHLCVYALYYSTFGKDGFQTKMQKAELAGIVTGARFSSEFTSEMEAAITACVETIEAWTDERQDVYPNEEIEKRVEEVFKMK